MSEGDVEEVGEVRGGDIAPPADPRSFSFICNSIIGETKQQWESGEMLKSYSMGNEVSFPDETKIDNLPAGS